MSFLDSIGQGLGAPFLLAKKHLYDDPADRQRGALNNAATGSRKLAEDQRNWYMQGLDRSLGQYAGSDATYKALYGDPGSLRK